MSFELVIQPPSVGCDNESYADLYREYLSVSRDAVVAFREGASSGLEFGGVCGVGEFEGERGGVVARVQVRRAGWCGSGICAGAARASPGRVGNDVSGVCFEGTGGCSHSCGEGSSGGVAKAGAALSCVGGGASSVDAGVGVSEAALAKTAANRLKRQRRAELKRKRRAAGVKRGDLVESTDSEVSVPEWRQKNVRAVVHKGVFADCSEEVQRELRETRAKMLVEKNKVAVVEAEHRRRTLDARLKSRIVEEEVERRRLELNAANAKLVEAKLSKQPQGFAETVVSMGVASVFDDASVSSGSISPNSSISVAALKKKDAALVALTKRIAELETEASEKKKIVVSTTSSKPASRFARMSIAERDRREANGLPLTGPGSGVDGYGKW